MGFSLDIQKESIIALKMVKEKVQMHHYDFYGSAIGFAGMVNSESDFEGNLVKITKRYK